jgi:hypothetical protein
MLGLMASRRRQTALISGERVTHSILLLRGYKVLLDTDLAALYGVETRALLQAVKRNLERFPEDFMLQLTPEECRTRRTAISILKAIRELMNPPVPKRRGIGFTANFDE